MKNIKFIVTAVIGGFIMWVISGLWHNLILPSLYADTHATHEGIFILLLAYVILAGFMVYLLPIIFKDGSLVMRGLKLGMFVGVLWILPYTLTMAGAHGTSLVYVVKNTLWHMVEQGLGGIFIALLANKLNK